jgi:hypothetical protein
MDLLPFLALMRVSKVYEEGAKKYRAHNWRRGIPLSRYADSGMRHMAKWMAGWRDEPHLDMAAWNLLCLIETQELIVQGKLPAELNDLPYNPLEIADTMDLPDLILPLEGSELDGVDENYDDEPEEKEVIGEVFVGDEKLADITSVEDVKVANIHEELYVQPEEFYDKDDMESQGDDGPGVEFFIPETVKDNGLRERVKELAEKLEAYEVSRKTAREQFFAQRLGDTYVPEERHESR